MNVTTDASAVELIAKLKRRLFPSPAREAQNWRRERADAYSRFHVSIQRRLEWEAAPRALLEPLALPLLLLGLLLLHLLLRLRHGRPPGLLRRLALLLHSNAGATREPSIRSARAGRGASVQGLTSASSLRASASARCLSHASGSLLRPHTICTRLPESIVSSTSLRMRWLRHMEITRSTSRSSTSLRPSHAARALAATPVGGDRLRDRLRKRWVSSAGTRCKLRPLAGRGQRSTHPCA